MGKIRRGAIAILLVPLALLASACSSGGSDETATAPAQTAGDPQVGATIAEMTKRYDALLATCDHKGLFALAYLRTTETYQSAAEEPGFFQDPAYLSSEDALFAKYYFDHIDDWTGGAKANVPPAWSLSFQTADARSVETASDLLLGISAHINQDLPYVIATLGVTDANGNSRKPDHDKVNQFLAEVTFNPDVVAHWDASYTLDYASGLSTIYAWRETAWQNALKILAAKTPAERSQVDTDISNNAKAAGEAFVGLGSYSGGDSSAVRDAFCAAHH